MVLNRREHRELLRALRLDEAIPYELVDRVDQHIATCPKCQGMLKQARQLKKRFVPMLSASHPTPEELLAYLTKDESTQFDEVGSFEKLKTHVDSCTLCQGRVKHMQGEIKEVESLMQNVAHELTFEQDYRPAVATKHSSPAKKKAVMPPMPRAIFPVAIACAAVLFVFGLSFSLQPKSYSFANLNSDRLDVLPVARGTSNTEVHLLLTESLINSGDYNKAQARLLQIDKNALSAEQILRLRLCDLMLTLKSAHRSYVRLFPHFDKSAVRESLAQMELGMVREIPATAANEAYLGLAHYYMAKAYLMLDDQTQAISHLQSSQQTAHLRRHEAEALLQALTRE